MGLKDVLVVSNKNILVSWWKHTAFILTPLSHIQLLPLLADRLLAMEMKQREELLRAQGVKDSCCCTVIFNGHKCN